ncbi:MAG: hypothetical protein AMXMBFR68_00280 [Ignavibacteria bacterium]
MTLCTIADVTVLMVHSPVSVMFRHVSFSLPVLTAVAGPIATIGGFEEKALKKEYGARFPIP